jgi:hypothetical protein
MKNDSHQLLVHALNAWQNIRLLGYIDPGSGSYGYQMLIAGLTGVLFFFSSVKRKVVSLFNKAGPGPDLADAPPSKDSLAPQSKDQSAVQ